MNAAPGNIVPLSIDLSALVRRSVASLYSHLVTRPMGQALRLGIENQLAELGEFCVSILDFTQVVVLDYSCADEAVAKLILRYQRVDRPAEVFFMARGVAEQHIEPIEAVLTRHELALVADVVGSGYELLGPASAQERATWHTLQGMGYANAGEIAARTQCTEPAARSALDALASRRAVVRHGELQNYFALSALLSKA
ncbi:MAG: hypothetical protein ACRENP_07875 [Longimicrobiales bacterium]